MSAALWLATAEAREHRDPLSRFRWQCDGAVRFATYVARGLETHAHTGNQGTKTTSGAAIAVAMLQGRSSLDGVKLPRLKLPATAWLMVKTRKGQVDSSQRAYREVIGGWPCKEAFSDRGRDYVETFWIRPERWTNDDPHSWSKIVVHCEESGESLPGGRVDIIHADEPPKRENWREARWRGKSNQPLYLFITETPLKRSEWWWLFNEEDGFINCLDRERGGRISVNWDVRDVRCHSDAHKAGLEAKAIGDLETRLTGWPVDDESVAPFSGRGLALYRAECLPPKIVRVPLFESGEDEHDRESLAAWAEYQTWCKSYDWGRYALVGDPSKGIDLAARSPSGFNVFEETDPSLVSRYNGRLDPYSFGWLAGTVGKVYQRADAHIETQGGYGLEAIRALRRMRYPNIAREVKQNNPSGAPRHDWGFSTSEGSKRAWIAAIQTMLEDKIAGRPTMNIWSSEVIDSLADAELDKETGKLKQDEHHRIEDVITLGYQLHRTLGPKRIRSPRRELDPVGRSLRAEFGRDIRPNRARPEAAPEAFRR